MSERRWASATFLVAALAFVAVAAWRIPWHPVPGGSPSPASAGSVFSPAQISRANSYTDPARILGWSALAVSGPSTPSTRTRLVRDDAPLTSETAASFTPRVRAMSAHVASFARPSVGGAATRTFNAAPWRPTTAVRPDRGWTCTSTTT